ncbi:MAG: signal peptidase I [Rickettsiaceae bacterium]|nr:signal peptidase I [Rickettsiaceae bacterium]
MFKKNYINWNVSAKDAWQEIKSFIILIFLALCIRALVFEPFYIPSGSMKNTLIEGDYVFATKYSYGYSKYSFIIETNLFNGRFFAQKPSRGDVVILRVPGDIHPRFIKRLIGLPGEKIELKNGAVYINDKPIERQSKRSYMDNGIVFEEYQEILENGVKYNTRYIKQFPAEGKIIPELTYANNIGPFYVPDGHYFFLGDNRDESGDSRFQLGFVPFENFIAKAQFVFFSFGELLVLDNFLSLEQINHIYKWATSFEYKRFFARCLYTS